MTSEQFERLNRLFLTKLQGEPMSKTRDSRKETRKPPKTVAGKKGGKGGRKGC